MDPVIGLRRRASGEGQPSILDLRHVSIVSRGRAAIALALANARIGAGDKVLMPAYNCPAMIAGVRAAGAQAQFFPIAENLAIEPREVLAAADRYTRAVLIPHFFAWRQSKGLFDYLAGNTSWLVLEDCAHAFFGARGADAPGSWGHVAIASVAKFFPSRWGGVVASGTRPLATPLRPSSSMYQLKLAANAAEEAAQFGRLGLASAGVRALLGAVSALRGKRLPSVAQAAPTTPAGEDTSYADVDLARLSEQGGWWVMRQIADRGSFARRAARRLEVYRQLSDALTGMRSAQPLFRDRTPDFPPYVFPLLLREQVESRFQALRARGVPMFRWEHAPAGRCALTDHYRTSVIQLPCHDALTAAEVASVVAAVRRELE
ncbi:MAG TPA: DegT/DnrJ/EryC1/StrS family aminotransferase [Steroidobacteraceae bacterium]|nr:DegT/DnrJ/EryC1/StrS family aminotransferase [Steroidobacteraceae bacterium]